MNEELGRLESQVRQGLYRDWMSAAELLSYQDACVSALSARCR